MARREAEDGRERAVRESAEREEELRAQQGLMEREMAAVRAGLGKKMEVEVAALKSMLRSQHSAGVCEALGGIEIQLDEIERANWILEEERATERQSWWEAVHELGVWRQRSEEAVERIGALQAEVREEKRRSHLRVLEKEKIIAEKEEALSAHRRWNLSRRYEAESSAARCASLQVRS